tara:strand:- start:2469 stop:3308 length:840 start_codon:yes stop_codon:yes gene_type:complete
MKVRVYGFNHSPWVQAVLLGLYDKKIEHIISQKPPLEVFKTWGVYMPAVSINDSPWEIESTKILTRLGYELIAQDDLDAAQKAWQGVLHRVDNPFRFFYAFSRGGEVSRSFFANSLSNFILSFVAFYMFILINIGKKGLKQKRPGDYGDQFLYWENILDNSEGSFIDGEEPGMRDLILFGIVQCHASIPVPALEALLIDERLNKIRIWISSMQDRFAKYPYLYSANFFEPKISKPKSTSLIQRFFFFFGLLLMFVAFPITIPLVLILMGKVKPMRIKRF